MIANSTLLPQCDHPLLLLVGHLLLLGLSFSVSMWLGSELFPLCSQLLRTVVKAAAPSGA